MNNGFVSFVFTFFTITVLIKTIAYGLYEIKSEKNIFGGVCTIAFSSACIVFSNIMVWIS